MQDEKAIPPEIRKEEAELRHEIELEDENTSTVYEALFKPTLILELKDHIDDEYAFAGVKDPRIVITTARDPSSRLAQFAKEVKLIFPNSQRVNRGNYVLKDLVNVCKSNEVSDLLVLHEHRGEPDGLAVCHLPYGPTAYFTLSNVVMRHDVRELTSKISEAYPHLIFENFQTSLGKRVVNIFKYLFPVPNNSKRIVTFSNSDDIISFRHHIYSKNGHGGVDIKEVGPRMELKLYQIRLGTIDQTEADVEWVARPYMTTTKKRSFL
ncbi:hypothetical protein Zmor_011783 [Zophobas morio]|uniref:Brix domain-containing protein n=1 Tax=Zophobas morio TaxID=2755281 RepID=A0AA38LZZ6_9CUCU|nr:hypothetical protein Zmor_011783 [Zophobas morio]